eukprot:gene17191-8732_t
MEVRVEELMVIRLIVKNAKIRWEFPANEEKRQLWIAAVRRWKWHPTKYSYICSDHFLVTDYKVPPGQPRPRLAPSAVPSIFPKFPKHLMREPPKTRRKLVRKNPCLKKGAKGQQKSQTVKKPKEGKSDPNSPTKMRLRKKIKILQQKLRRRNQKIKTMGDLIDTMKNKELLSQSSADLLKDQFSGTCLELFLNEVKNKGRKPAGRRYSEELKQFALTVNFYSHRAYNFLRKIFKLPHESSIKQWTASVNCEPGFLTEVFQDLENQSKDKPEMLDCALLIDGMSIRKQVTYDQLKSKYSGFVDYGNIIPENSENLASEALVFMLTGLKSHWKCPVGYFLTDKLNAESQASLIKTGLSLAADHGFRVWSITCDAEELLMRNNDPYRFLLTYKFSQDHIELLFSCVRARGGFNNNPNTVQFKTALRQILMRNSIMASNKANVLSFEAESNGSIFSLRASKRRTPVAELLKPISEDETIESEEELHHLFGSINVTSLQENILYYISGFIIRKIIHKIDCQQCSESLVIPVSSTDHFYATMPYAMLVSRKNRGGLIQASYGAFKVVEQCEKSFKMNVINSSRNQITSESNLLRKMLIQVVSVCDWQQHFPCIGDHGFEVEPGFQDDHLTQLVKKVSIRYLTMRLQTYGKRYTRQIVNSNTPSIRHQMNKLILFKNI